MQNTQETKAEAHDLIDSLRSGDNSDTKITEIVERLDVLMPDPNYWEYVIDLNPPRAFAYKPIQL